MTEEPNEHEAIELMMPFVTTVTNGGTHDDRSYVAGWEMGALDAELEHAAPQEWGHPIHEENAAQADLIAMRRGYQVTLTELGDGWTMLKLVKNAAERT